MVNRDRGFDVSEREGVLVTWMNWMALEVVV